MFHAHGPSDGRTDMIKLIVAFRNFAKVLKNYFPADAVFLCDINPTTAAVLTDRIRCTAPISIAAKNPLQTTQNPNFLTPEWIKLNIFPETYGPVISGSLSRSMACPQVADGGTASRYTG